MKEENDEMAWMEENGLTFSCCSHWGGGYAERSLLLTHLGMQSEQETHVVNLGDQCVLCDSMT